jgi:hypothetical protein
LVAERWYLSLLDERDRIEAIKARCDCWELQNEFMQL